MNSKTKLLVLLLFTIAILGIIAPVSGTESVNSGNKVFSIESKEKSLKLKINWNANGGKVGKKTKVSTSVKKGSKIGKFPTTPKRSGYSFKGWYTKKTKGSKVSENTKVANKVTFFAQWKKKSSGANSNIDKKLLGGIWYKLLDSGERDYYSFRADGKFIFSAVNHIKHGNYKVSNGKIIFTNVAVAYHSGQKKNYPNTIVEYETYTEKESTFLKIAVLDYPDKNNLPLSYAWRWIKR